MVTVLHKEINSRYQTCTEWIIFGITIDAILVCSERWQDEDYLNRKRDVDEIRNKGWRNKTIKPLNKW